MEKLERGSQEAGRLRLGTISKWSRRTVSSFHVSEWPMSLDPDCFPLFLFGDQGRGSFSLQVVASWSTRATD